MYNPFQLQPKEKKKGRFTTEELLPYASHFNEPDFWKKIASNAAAVGRQFTERALTLYYGLADNLPAWGKSVIIGALGYFILPLDAIPDFFPGVGYMDDMGALATAFATVGIYISPESVERAQQKVNEWFDKAKATIPQQEDTVEIDEQASEGHA